MLKLKPLFFSILLIRFGFKRRESLFYRCRRRRRCSLLQSNSSAVPRVYVCLRLPFWYMLCRVDIVYSF